jgi:hypothetical protein
MCVAANAFAAGGRDTEVAEHSSDALFGVRDSSHKNGAAQKENRDTRHRRECRGFHWSSP